MIRTRRDHGNGVYDGPRGQAPVISYQSLQVGSELQCRSQVEGVQTAQLGRTDASGQFEYTSPEFEQVDRGQHFMGDLDVARRQTAGGSQQFCTA